MWLEVGASNNNPAVVAKYYAECVRQMEGVPRIIRADNGTENVIIAGLQRFFRSDCNDAFAGAKSFMYGRSVTNQRIEAWWSFLRKSNADWWIVYFKDLKDNGLFCDDNPVHSACLKFSFMPLLQSELHRVARHWNTHRIRPYPNQETPPGKPDVLFFIPEHTNSSDYKTLVDLDTLDVVEEAFCEGQSRFGCEKEFVDVFQMLMEENSLTEPKNVIEAENLYFTLLTLLQGVV